MSFDRLAPVYRLMECVLAGDKLQRCRIAHLAQAKNARNALLLGEGVGRFIVPLLTSNPHMHITCVDASASMLEQTRCALTRAGLDTARVEFVCADIMQWRPEKRGFDLIATHFFLDCFPAEQLALLISRLSTLTSSDALWLVSDFTSPPHGLLRLRAQLITWSMYRFFRVATRIPARQLVDYTPMLIHHGFQLSARQTFDWGLLRSDCWHNT